MVILLRTCILFWQVFDVCLRYTESLHGLKDNFNERVCKITAYRVYLFFFSSFWVKMIWRGTEWWLIYYLALFLSHKDMVCISELFCSCCFRNLNLKILIYLIYFQHLFSLKSIPILYFIRFLYLWRKFYLWMKSFD